jgi:hypothetical protein
MSQYRVYYLDDDDHVTHAADIDAADDGAARAQARALASAVVVEIWKLDRFLCRFAPLASGRDAAVQRSAVQGG